MTSNKPVQRNSSSDQPSVEKPYKLIPFPQDSSGRFLSLEKRKPIGLDRYMQGNFSGSTTLRLHVQTATTVASGLIVQSNDLSDRVQKNSLVKTAVSTSGKLIIPGSSLKGAIRSIYEAITRSCICKRTKSYKLNKQRFTVNIPPGYQECSPKAEEIKSRQAQVCPACQIFGAMSSQGMIGFTDAICERNAFESNFLPSLYAPHCERDGYYSDYQNRRVGGRKFYYNFVNVANKADKGIDVQQAVMGYTFLTHLRFMNLSNFQLGGLLIALGQDLEHKFALKLGTGKPIGMGSITIDVVSIELWATPGRSQANSKFAQNLRDRYTSYTLPNSDQLTGEKLQQFMQQAIQAAHKDLIQAPQLQQLAEVLKFPTDRTAPEGMY